MIFKKETFSLLCVLLFSGCSSKQKALTYIAERVDQFSQYSTSVKDTFSIQTQLPLEYQVSSSKSYPVVVLLDANFHFPMLAASIRQYELGGLMPPMILVGVGYRSFKEMDSLRVRDYLYPSALPSDEMVTPGGGEKFRQFIVTELLSEVDSKFRTQKNNRTLLGHSFGGYFTMYALLKQAQSGQQIFKNFIAASPSLWYHDFYLKQLENQLAAANPKDSLLLFMSAGGLENSQWDIKPNSELRDKLDKVGTITVKGAIYSTMDHMDTGQFTFVKGLQAAYAH